MGICSSKKNSNLGRLGNRSTNINDFKFSDTNDFKIDLLNHCVKDPPNICSPFESNSNVMNGPDKYDNYLNDVIKSQSQNGHNGRNKQQKRNKNGIKRDIYKNLANGTIRNEILICGYLRALLAKIDPIHIEINQEKLIPLVILNAVKQTYFPQYIALEIGASNKSFYSTFKMSHLLSSSNSIHYNGGNDQCFLSTIHEEIYCTDQEPRAFQLIEFFKKENHTNYIDIISHGISNKHLFISTISKTGKQSIYCKGKNQFGQCGLGHDQGNIFQYTQIKNFWKSEMLTLQINGGIGKEKIKDIKCGQYHTIFLTQNGNVWSVGQNWVGQCGIGDSVKKVNEPQLLKFEKNNIFITPLSSNNDLNPGYPASVVGIDQKIDNTVSDFDESGLLNFEESIRIKAISCGDTHNLVIDEHNELWIFGHLAVNNNMKEKIYEPIKHPYFQGIEDNNNNINNNNDKIRITRINTGADHSVVCDSNGFCYTFGNNDKGQIGHRYLEMQFEPYIFQKSTDPDNKNKFIFESTKIIDVEAGQCHTVLLTSTNDVITFGSNHFKQCSTVNKNEIICFGHRLMRHEEIGITSNTYIERIIASANSTIILINTSKKLKILR